MGKRSIPRSLLHHSSGPIRDRGFPTIDECREQHDACEEANLLDIEDRAFIAFGHQNYREAAACFECLMHRDAEMDDSALYTYGLCLKKLGHAQGALRVFEPVITGGRTCRYDILAGLESADILQQQGKTDEALEALRRARTRDPVAFEKYAGHPYRHLWELVDRLE
jgi:tetratricopeptide (TPR) repeat protein